METTEVVAKTTVVLPVKKEARIYHERADGHVEYRIYNTMAQSTWGVAVVVYQGADMQSLILFPEDERTAELQVIPAVVLHFKYEDRSLVISYPAEATCTLHDMKI
jgi:hypothetical protein